MVWAGTFPFEKLNAHPLCALSLTIEYGDVDQVKRLIKETKDKRKALLKYFPPWICHESKDKKNRKKVIEMLEQYRGKDATTLQLWFLRECLKWKFFGALEFPVKCVVPPATSGNQEDVLFTVTEEELERFSVKNAAVRKWKPMTEELVVFHYISGKRDASELHVNYPNVLLLIDHITALMNFLKQQKLAQQTDELGD
jgi:hypothetical protein